MNYSKYVDLFVQNSRLLFLRSLSPRPPKVHKSKMLLSGSLGEVRAGINRPAIYVNERPMALFFGETNRTGSQDMD